VLPARTSEEKRSDVRHGVRTGLQYALGLSIIATIALAVVAAKGGAAQAAIAWLAAVAFYFVAGFLGGALYGFLRPIRKKLWGRLVTAYLLLLLVYGGGTLGFWPLFTLADPSLRQLSVLLMVGVWAVVSLVLAPVYVLVLWLRDRK
jgi:hypothetical protein